MVPSALTVYSVLLPVTLLLTATLVPALTLVVFAASCTAFNWLTFTASVSAAPLATLLITLPPALMPSLVTLGPPLTWKPVFEVTVPAKVGASTICTSILPLLTTVFTLEDEAAAVAPPTTSMVLFRFLVTLVPSWAVKPNVALSKLSFTVNNWLPVTASLLPAAILPSFRLVNVTGVLLPVPPKVTLVLPALSY